MRTPSKIFLLTSLYLSQGLPFGFFTQSLPVLLRQDGVSLAAIGSTSLLALPWGLKFLWAPYVDRLGSRSFGHRKSWIVPLQGAAVCLMLGLAFLDPKRGLAWLFAGVLCANLIAATQDIATDALAVELLSEHERGLGNGVQVAGYRVGMIIGGGLLLVVYDRLGWTRSFFVMALLLALSTLPVWFHRERPAIRAHDAPPLGLRTILRTLSRPELRGFLPVLMFYKAGDALGSAMLRPFLVDTGRSLEEIGWLLGTIGFVAGLLGALAGGVATSRMPRRTALALFGAGHASCLLLYALCASTLPSRSLLYLALSVEHFLGGMATTALFTSMMDHTSQDSAGTDYTVQASLVVAVGGLFGLASGWSAQAFGYGAHFGLSALLAAFGASLAWALMPAPDARAQLSKAP